MKSFVRLSGTGILIGLLILFLNSCGGGSKSDGILTSTPTTTHSVTLSWTSNHETGVNSPGGGYRISISGQPSFDVLYTEPTTTTVLLKTGSYTVKVQAFAALDAQGGNTVSYSAASTKTINVP